MCYMLDLDLNTAINLTVQAEVRCTCTCQPGGSGAQRCNKTPSGD